MKTKHCMLFIIALLSLSKSISSQTSQWAAQFGGTPGMAGKAIATDSEGTVYTTGDFLVSADFNPGAGTFNLRSAGQDVFISKLDASGNLFWAKKLGGSSIDQVSAITADDAGNVYTTGNFSGIADFDTGAGKFNLGVAGGGFISSNFQINPLFRD